MNIFGGIVDCAVISSGIVKAAKTIDLKIPIVARLEGKSLFQRQLFTFHLLRLCKPFNGEISFIFIFNVGLPAYQAYGCMRLIRHQYYFCY